MKILIFSNTYSHTARSGAVQMASRIASELVARGHQVTVLSTERFSGPSSWRARVAENDVEVVKRFYPANFYQPDDASRFPAPVRVLWHLIDLWSPHPKWVAKEVIRRREPDVILTHNLKGIGLQVCAAIRESGVPWIHTAHDVQLSVPSGVLIAGSEGGPFNSTPLRRLYELATSRAFGSPDVVISPSKFLADFYRERGFFKQSRLEVIPNPAPIVTTQPVSNRPPGPMRLYFIGQMEEHKGIRFLLRAIDRLDVPFHLHVIGEGTLSSLVARWAKEDSRITYHGYLSFEPFTKLLALCDATVIPSLCYENSPTAIYEAFAAGKPVIASRIGGVGELVKDGENGLLLPPGDSEAWRAGLKKFSEQRDLFRSRAAEIRASVEAYALPKYVSRLEGIIDEVRRTGTP